MAETLRLVQGPRVRRASGGPRQVASPAGHKGIVHLALRGQATAPSTTSLPAPGRPPRARAPSRTAWLALPLARLGLPSLHRRQGRRAPTTDVDRPLRGGGARRRRLRRRDGGGPEPHRRTVSDVMAETMVNWGIRARLRHGGALEPRPGRRAAASSEEEGNLTYIGIRHEGAAAFACSGLRASSPARPAACFSPSPGPGATNLMTGLWDAKVDRAPVLALAGQVNTQVLGPGAFQEADLAAAFAPSLGAVGADRAARQQARGAGQPGASSHAILERDGVSHLIFPDEVQTLLPAEGVTRRPAVPPVACPTARSRPRQDEPRARRPCACSRGAERPVIIVGHGARFDMEGDHRPRRSD